MLRIFPQNEDDTLIVKDVNGDISPMLEVNLGLHFQRTAPADRVHRASAPQAHAYGAGYSVRDVAHFGSTVVELNDRGVSEYIASTETISLDVRTAEHSTSRHEFGHRLMHHLYGDHFYFETPNCSPHYFPAPSSPECALSEGYAHVVGLLAENDNGRLPWTRRTYPPTPNAPAASADIETCTDEAGNPCQAGASVEGRVAAALLDLADPGVERVEGFADRTGHGFDPVNGVFATAKPTTFDQFWLAWMSTHGTPEDTEAAWMNTLDHPGLVHESEAGASGGWQRVDCALDFCTGVGTMQSVPGTGQPPTMRWTLNPAMAGATPPSNGWRIYVHIPDGPMDGLDTRAVYDVETAQGVVSYTVDQQAAVDSWVELNPGNGWILDPADPDITVTLRQTTRDGSTIALADGLLVTPAR